MSAKITVVRFKYNVRELKVGFVERKRNPLAYKQDIKLFDDDSHGIKTARYYMFFTFTYLL